MLNILVVIGVCFFVFAEKSEAIVLLPAIILIPLAKLLAVVVAGLSVPVASIGIFIAKITKNKRFAIGLSMLILFTITIMAAIFLRINHRDNPWF